MIMRQMKSNLYYVFWGIATVAVVAGQVYVGLGYREMANEIRTAREATTDFIEGISDFLY